MHVIIFYISEIVDVSLENWKQSSPNLNVNQKNITNTSVPVASNIQQTPPAPVKKEPLLKSWFSSSSSSTVPSTSTDLLPTTQSSTTTKNTSSILPTDLLIIEKLDSGIVDASSPRNSPDNANQNNDNSSKSNNGNRIDQAYSKSAIEHQQQQHKSSRRTSSLLNLFMSHSQGMIANIVKTITVILYIHT